MTISRTITYHTATTNFGIGNTFAGVSLYQRRDNSGTPPGQKRQSASLYRPDTVSIAPLILPTPTQSLGRRKRKVILQQIEEIDTERI